MSKWVHRILEKDLESLLGVCASCGPVRLSRKGEGVRCFEATKKWKYQSTGQRTPIGKSISYRKHKKNSCEACGFVPEHPCQLDVDHIDGDKQNSDESNLQTLCANCHRLKTQVNNDFLRRSAPREP